MGRLFVCLLLVCALLTSGAQADELSGYVRLHVVANSDSVEDQQLKQLVRDGVRALCAVLVKDCGNAQQACAVIEENLPLIECTARVFARLGGHEGRVSAQAGVFEFPEKAYGEIVLPAGNYRALRVTLGEGAGQNWWCVLYPSLCVPLEDEQPVFYSAIARWLKGCFAEVGQWIAAW